MSARTIPKEIYCSKTKNKILDVATKLFALNGVSAVSMRDIGKEIGIKMDYYYDGKDALFEDIMARFENGYRHYFEWLQNENANANTLDELMDNMFNEELLGMHDPIGCLGMSLLMKEQHNNLSARKRVSVLFFEYSVMCLKTDFDNLIKKGIIPPNDTETISKLFMNNIVIYNDMRLHGYAGNESSVDCSKEFGNLKKFLTCVLAQGLNK